MLELFTKAQSFFAAKLKREDGQALVEYALILALIAIVAIAALQLLGANISSQLSGIGARLPVGG